jgi:Glycosyltransferases involved in cell wall biogenesis
MHPTFSIITVTYNAEQWLERTVLSVLCQSYFGVEYIIIDGGSKDGTIDIIKQYETGVASWISEPDSGLYDAMNKGLRKATGDYILFLNAGDTFHTNDTLQQIVGKISKRKALPDIIYGETEIVSAEGLSLGQRRLKTPSRLTWKSFRMGMLVCHQSFFANRNIAVEYDLQYRFSADFDWCIKCLKQAKSIHNSRLIISNFLDEGMTTQNHKASLKERYNIMNRYYGRISTALLHIWFAIRFYFAKWFRKRN